MQMIKIDGVVNDCYADKYIYNFIGIASNLNNAKECIINDLERFIPNNGYAKFSSCESVSCGVHVVYDVYDEDGDMFADNITYYVSNVDGDQLYGYEDDSSLEHEFDDEEFWVI